VRDFRDMVASILAFNRKRGEPMFGRDLAASDEEYVRGHLKGSATTLAEGWKERSDSAFLVRYEDLVLNPHDVLPPLLRFLDLEAGDARVDEMLAATAGSDARGQKVHKTTSSAAESVGRWRKSLSPALIEACQDAFAEELQLFGYSA
jgi:hypothetical protein